jgi:glycosyltransferase involved in cell wall biosynthesis
VLVVASRLRGDARREHRDGVTVARVSALNVLEEKLSVPVPVVGRAVALELEAFKPDVIVAHGHSYLSSWWAALAARRLSVPFVIVQHNPFVEYGRVLNAVERLVDRSAGRWVLHEASAVVCVSRHVARYVHSIAPKARTTVVHNGVDVQRFVPGPSTVEHSVADSEARTLRVGTLRRLVPRQGVDVLVQAWREHGLGERAELVVGGSGNELSRLQDIARGDESITFLGRVSDEALAGFYQSCDVFVLPTTSGEGFGLVAAEALACGVPVVATDEGGAKEVVRDGVDGVHVKARDTASIAAGITLMLSDNERRLEMAEAARSRSLSWDERCRELLGVLRSVTH